MVNTPIKQATFTLLLALLLSGQCLPAHGRAPPPPPEDYTDWVPTVHIYYLGGFHPDIFAPTYIESIIDLDGEPGKPRWGCVFRPPDSLQFYNAVYPLLTGAAEGLFESRDIRMKIVNKTSGEHIYFDRYGGLYFYGDTMTRKMSDEDFLTMREMLSSLQNCSRE